MKTAQNKKTLRVARFALAQDRNGTIEVLPMILANPSKGARNCTAVFDSNGFGGIAVCSHKDRFDDQTGALLAFQYRDRARHFHKKTGVKVIMAKNQMFPKAAVLDKILDYVNRSPNVELIDVTEENDK